VKKIMMIVCSISWFLLAADVYLLTATMICAPMPAAGECKPHPLHLWKSAAGWALLLAAIIFAALHIAHSVAWSVMMLTVQAKDGDRLVNLVASGAWDEGFFDAVWGNVFLGSLALMLLTVVWLACHHRKNRRPIEPSAELVP
jgi:CDP-diglyceride synthetase